MRIKKAILLLTTLLLLSNCTDKKSETILKKPQKDDSLLTELQNSLGDDILITELKLTNPVFANRKFVDYKNIKTNDSIVINLPIDNGKIVEFKNSTNPNNETEDKSYEYKGFENLTNLHWVAEELYEDEKNLLISKTNGQTYEIWNEPIINSGGNYIFTKQQNCFMMFDDCHPGFQIWELKNDELKLYKEIKLANYYVSSGGWKTNNILLIELRPLEALINPSKKKEIYKYELKINR